MWHWLRQVDDEPAPRAQVVDFAAGLLGVRSGGSHGAGATTAATATATGGAGGRASSEPASGDGSQVQAGSGGSGRGSTRAAPLEEKRVRNARLKDRLGLQLAYPSYREGLAAIASGRILPFEGADLARLGRRVLGE